MDYNHNLHSNEISPTLESNFDSYLNNKCTGHLNINPPSDDDSPLNLLKDLKLENVHRLVIAQSNINSLAEKFEAFTKLFKVTWILRSLPRQSSIVLFHPNNLLLKAILYPTG